MNIINEPIVSTAAMVPNIISTSKLSPATKVEFYIISADYICTLCCKQPKVNIVKTDAILL